eukprot:gene29189-38664_t
MASSIVGKLFVSSSALSQRLITNKSLSKAMVSLTIMLALQAVLQPHALAAKDDDPKRKKNDKEENSLLDEFAENARKASDQHDIFAKLKKSLEGVVLTATAAAPEGGSVESLKKFMESPAPGQIGYGFLMGYSSGFCLKKCVVQFLCTVHIYTEETLQYSGFIKIDYETLQRETEKVLDVNNDGKVDEEDAKVVFNKVKDVLGNQMPAGGGFSVGFLMGFRR